MTYEEKLSARAWISVEEALPGNCAEVLLFTPMGISLGYYDVFIGEWYDYTNTDNSRVTHWMILPEPPKEG